MKKLKNHWEFNVLNIYDYNKDGPYNYIFKFLRENQLYLSGDIFEAGTFNARTALSFSMFLKELELPGLVRAFDTFEGFPSYSEFDDYEKFHKLFAEGKISKKHMSEIFRMIEYVEGVLGKSLHPSDISSSGNFGNVDFDLIEKKKEFLELDNLILYKGQFAESFRRNDLQNCKFSLAFIDCDLYMGYVESLDYVWPKLVPGGIVFLDEYYSLKFPGPRLAVEDFLQKLKNDSFHFKMVSNPQDDFERWIIKKL